MTDILTANLLEETEILSREREILEAAKQYLADKNGPELSALVAAFNAAALGLGTDMHTAYCQMNSEMILRQAEAYVSVHEALARKHAFMQASEHTDPRALDRIETITRQQYASTVDLLDHAINVMAASSDEWLSAETAASGAEFLRNLADRLDSNTTISAPAIPRQAEKRFGLLIGYNTQIATSCKTIAALTLLEMKIDLGAYAGHAEAYKLGNTAFIRPSQYKNKALAALLGRLQAYQNEAKRAEMENMLLQDHIGAAPGGRIARNRLN